MPGVNYLAVGVAAVAAFVSSAAWYALFGGEVMELRGAETAAAADTEPATATPRP